MTSLHFIATIQIIGVNPYVLVGDEQASQLKKDWRKPIPVLVKVNGKPDEPWQINMMPAGDGNFYLYLAGEVRKASRTKVGDLVELDVCFDPNYKNGPMHPMPSWFEKPLNDNVYARQAWHKLPPSRQKEILRYFARLKSGEAQKRNLEKALYVLSGKEGRFMGRSWKNGK